MTLSSRLHRSALTLVELLIAIVIISILAALVLGIAAVAGETARETQTRHTIDRLDTLLRAHYETYKTRRVRVRQEVVDAINAAFPTQPGMPGYNPQNTARRGRALAEARLYALRELMVMEMPDRWSDVLLGPVPANPAGMSDARLPIYLDSRSLSANGRTPLGQAYLRRYHQLVMQINQLPAAERPAAIEALQDFQGAECLYMIITLACGDGEARTLFGESSIGDYDGDGAPEFLDGWGRPINFLRWAPGFESEIQLNANRLGNPPPPTQNNPDNLWLQQANRDHDPFDMFRIEPAAFRLVPLIFSAGRDETFGVRIVKPFVAWQGTANPAAPFNWNNRPRLTPYRLADANNDPEGGDAYLGTIMEGAADNIHNHLMGRR